MIYNMCPILVDWCPSDSFLCILELYTVFSSYSLSIVEEKKIQLSKIEDLIKPGKLKGPHKNCFPPSFSYLTNTLVYVLLIRDKELISLEPSSTIDNI